MNTLTTQVNQNLFNNQQQHEYNMMQQMLPQQQQRRSDSVSSIDASSTSLLYANKIFIEDFEHSDMVLTERVLTELEQILYNNNGSGQDTSSKVKSHKMCPPRQTMGHEVSTSLPQLPVYHQQHSFKHYIAAAESMEGRSQEELGFESENQKGDQTSKPYGESNTKKLSNQPRPQQLFNDFKVNPFHYHSMDTFGRFIRQSLNLSAETVTEITSNPRIQYWIDKNKCHGLVYQNSKLDKTKRRVPLVRCELCKFYGHLSHNCSVKDLAFKLNNVVIKNGACRCHICGQLGHPAETGMCPFIACSFCCQNGHWNYMCPNKDKISRTLCFKCQRYGHSTERCPDQWRQFDRISTFEQTPVNDNKDNKKPVYCYQCAQKGHYGHNCPDFYRKYFIRDFHQIDTYPVYFFASSSPYVKYAIKFTENDERIVQHLIEQSLDDRFRPESVDEDPLDQLEKLRANTTENSTADKCSIFNEGHANIPLKEYIRKWSNWIIDFHWIFTLKYFIEFLPTNKLHFFIKNYPSLDNFILHWMWWSYSLNKDLERLTKDPFRAIGTMPWLVFDADFKEDVADRPAVGLKEQKTAQEILELEEECKRRVQVHLSCLRLEQMERPRQKRSWSRFFEYNRVTVETVYRMGTSNAEESEALDRIGVDMFLCEKEIYVTGKRVKRSELVRPRSNSCSNVGDIDVVVQALSEYDSHKETSGESYKEKCNQLRSSSSSLNKPHSTLMVRCHSMVNMIHEIPSPNGLLQCINRDKNRSESDHLTSEILNTSEAILKSKALFINEDDNLKRYIEDQLNLKIESNEDSNLKTNKNEVKRKEPSQKKRASPVSSISAKINEQEPNVFERFFKSFNNCEDNGKIQKQNEKNLSRIFELLNKKSKKAIKEEKTESTRHGHYKQSPEDTEKAQVQQQQKRKSTESTNMIKFLLKIEPTSAPTQATSGDWTDTSNGHINVIDTCTLDPMKLANIEKKIEADPDKLDAALSIYNDCPTTLNKILLSTKNPIIVDTSHQPGLLVLSSSSSSSSSASASIAMKTTTTNPSSLSSTSPTSNASNSSAKSTPETNKQQQQPKQQKSKQLASYKSVSSLLSSRSSSVVSTGFSSVKTTPNSATKANRKQEIGSFMSGSVSYSKTNKSKGTTGNDEQHRREKRDSRDVKERERNGTQKSAKQQQQYQQRTNPEISKKTNTSSSSLKTLRGDKGLTKQKSTSSAASASSQYSNSGNSKNNKLATASPCKDQVEDSECRSKKPSESSTATVTVVSKTTAEGSATRQNQRLQLQQQQHQAVTNNQNANYYYQSNNLRQQYANYEANGKPGQRTSMGTSNSSVNTNSGYEATTTYHRPWTPTTFNSQDYHSEMQKQHQQRMQNIENGTATSYFQYPYANIAQQQQQQQSLRQHSTSHKSNSSIAYHPQQKQHQVSHHQQHNHFNQQQTQHNLHPSAQHLPAAFNTTKPMNPAKQQGLSNKKPFNNHNHKQHKENHFQRENRRSFANSNADSENVNPENCPTGETIIKNKRSMGNNQKVLQQQQQQQNWTMQAQQAGFTYQGQAQQQEHQMGATFNQQTTQQSTKKVPFQSTESKNTGNLSLSTSPHSSNATVGAYIPLGNIINSNSYKVNSNQAAGNQVDKKQAAGGSLGHRANGTKVYNNSSNVEDVLNSQNHSLPHQQHQQHRVKKHRHSMYSPSYPPNGSAVRYSSNENLVKMPTVPPMPSGLSQTGPPSARVFYGNPSGQNNHLMGQRHPSGTYNQAPGAYYNNLNALNSALIQQMSGQLSSGQTPFAARPMNGLNPASGHQHTKHKTKQAFRKQPTN